MKSYTNIEQSKRLKEILQPESADMCYCIDDDSLKYDNLPCLIPYYKYTAKEFYIPCWSLAALIDVIPDSIYDNTDEFSQLEFSKRSVAYHDLNDGIKIGSLKDNLIDACYEMILKLHKLKLL